MSNLFLLTSLILCWMDDTEFTSVISLYILDFSGAVTLLEMLINNVLFSYTWVKSTSALGKFFFGHFVLSALCTCPFIGFCGHYQRQISWGMHMPGDLQVIAIYQLNFVNTNPVFIFSLVWITHTFTHNLTQRFMHEAHYYYHHYHIT